MTFYRRPTKLTQIMNGALGWLASLGLTPSHMITLEVKGRRSGETRSTVMNIVEYEGERTSCRRGGSRSGCATCARRAARR